MEADTAAPALTVRGISKTYRLWATPGSRLWVPLLYRAAGLLPLPALAAWLRRRAQARVHDHPALQGVDFSLRRGEALGIIGHNGSGKSTLLGTLAGLIRPMGGRVEWRGRDITRCAAERMAALGIALVPEGRQLFAPMTVEDNLRLGAYRRNRADAADTMRRVYDLFPVLHDRRRQPAGTLSGGQQQMVAIGRALMSEPRLLLLDEPSMGLAPQIVEQIFEIVRDINQREGVTFLLAEQNTNMALRYADHGYILESGRIVMEGAAKELRENEDVKEFYLGMGGGDRKSFKDVKSYKRRKRWLA